mmetsp:Transcript_20951/g.38420  ORF Transcript_20951/g.38420 Transcript_20951/m.38420 type:complete len:237 (+) Transcript_20951:93-803(+)
MPKHEAAASLAPSKSAKAAKKTAENEELTPYDSYFAKLDAAKRKDPKILGPMLIRGIPDSNDSDDEVEAEDDEDDEEEKDTSKYTAEQMSILRYVLITQKRNDRLDEMRAFILGDQADHGMMMFNTSFSHEVQGGFYDFKSSLYAKAKTPANKFDLLYAYTYHLKEYDVWMHDNEGGMEGMVKDLASMWKRLLKNDDEKLGIDAEYTRPGVVQLLEDFKELVESAYSEPPFKFKFQ